MPTHRTQTKAEALQRKRDRSFFFLLLLLLNQHCDIMFKPPDFLFFSFKMSIRIVEVDLSLGDSCMSAVHLQASVQRQWSGAKMHSFDCRPNHSKFDPKG